jgi:hypothetical protein
MFGLQILTVSFFSCGVANSCDATSTLEVV